jgi:hypothetical protein
LRRADVVALDCAVHKANFYAIGIEEGCSICDALENQFHVVDALAAFFVCH